MGHPREGGDPRMKKRNKFVDAALRGHDKNKRIFEIMFYNNDLSKMFHVKHML